MQKTHADDFVEDCDPELERLNQGLQAINQDFWRRSLKTTYQEQFPEPVKEESHEAGRGQEIVWQVLGSILNDKAMGYVAERLDSLSSNDKKTCWDILQKVAAHENNTHANKETTYDRMFVHNPHYVKEDRRKVYANLSTALPLQHTYYPPGVKEPTLDATLMEKRMEARK